VTELTEKQIYSHWVHLNEAAWRLDDDQVTSARTLLRKLNGEKIEIIPIHQEDGINTIAFAFKDILDDFGDEILEIAMDSTCTCLELFFASAHQQSINRENKRSRI